VHQRCNYLQIYNLTFNVTYCSVQTPVNRFFKYFGEYSAKANAFLTVIRPINEAAIINFIAVWP